MPLSLQEIYSLMQELRGWNVENGLLIKDYNFEEFREAIDFVNQVASVAEEHGHHPTIIIDYTSVRLTLTTHDAGGLTQKDFTLAKAIDNSEGE